MAEAYHAWLLGRAGDAVGVQAWLGVLPRAAATPAQIAEIFLATDEFFARAGAGLLDGSP